MADPNSLIVPTFRMHAVLNEAKTKAKGRPIYDDIEVIEIRFAGDRQKVAVFPAHEHEPNATREAAAQGEEPVTYAQVYSRQYEAFREREDQTTSGTPLAELPFLTEGRRKELRAVNVHSAEALAALDGPRLKALGMDGRELKNQAQAYLDAADATADPTAQAAEIASLREQLAQKDAELNAANEAAKAKGGKGKRSQPQPPAPIEPVDEGEGRPIEELSDAELRAYIEAETHEIVDIDVQRSELIERATEIATRPE